MSLADWRDLAIVLLALEAFVLSLVPAVILYFGVRGMIWLLRQVRGHAPTVQGYFRKAAQLSDRVSRRVVNPIIGIEAGMARARRSGSSFFSSHPIHEV